MAVDGKDSAERDQTDEGLRKERRETDRALAERQAAIEKDADIVVEHARETADAVLAAARDEADRAARSNARLGACRVKSPRKSASAKMKRCWPSVRRLMRASNVNAMKPRGH